MKLKYVFFLCLISSSFAAKKLSPLEFLNISVTKNPQFQELILKEIAENYKRNVNRRVYSALFSATPAYVALIDGASTFAGTLSLNVDVPETGSQVGVNYQRNVSSSGSLSHALEATLSQSLVKNAFGMEEQQKIKLGNLRWNISKYQIIDQYEDLLASMLRLYLDWALAYFNFQNAKETFEEDKQIRLEVGERYKKNIALPVDLQKADLELLRGKKQLLRMSNTLNEKEKMIRQFVPYSEVVPLYPELKPITIDRPKEFDLYWSAYTNHSRMFKVYNLTQKEKEHNKKLALDKLLPTVDLEASYKQSGTEVFNESALHNLKIGLNFNYSIPMKNQRDEYKVAVLEDKQFKRNASYNIKRLKIDLKVLYDSIGFYETLTKINEEETKLTESIFKKEELEYIRGRIELRDLIASKNNWRRVKLEAIENQIRYSLVLIEWLRVSDSLLDKNQLQVYEETKQGLKR